MPDCGAEVLADDDRERDGSVHTGVAADGYGARVGLLDSFYCLVDKRLRCWLADEPVLQFWVPAVERSERWDLVWVWELSGVDDEVGVWSWPFAVSEGDDVHCVRFTSLWA